ncbi:MAG: hypothetical protein ACYC27_09785 [Armatimonadota bacterium]
MNEQRTWPSRRLQIAIIIILAAAALIRGFMPPLSKEGRAEKLYIDSWYAGLGLTGIPNPDGSEKAVKMLEKAIELQPGNSMYEQALVWQYQREKRTELLDRPKPLGKEARVLASGLIYEYSEKKAKNNTIELPANVPSGQMGQPTVKMMPGMPGYSKQFSPEYWQEKLQRLDALIAADPDNALPRYMRALAYSDMERPSDMLAEVKTGNRLNLIRAYMPKVADDIKNSMAGEMIFTDYESHAKYRELARRINDYGNKQLRSGNANEAVATLEECCLMGVRMSAREPKSHISNLVSQAIFAIGWKSLEPAYKDLGMEDKLRQYQRIEDAYNNNSEEIKLSITNMDYSLITRAFIFTGFAVSAASFSLSGLILALIGWWIMVLVRKKKGQEILSIPAWSEGWLARFFMIAYLPIVILTGLALISKPFLDFLFDKSGSIFIIVAYSLALIIATLVVLRRRYIEHTGERIGFWRFVFRVPSSVGAWKSRSFAAMFAGQLIFIICCGSVITLFYKSAYGAHPWQPMRIQYGMMSQEKAMASKFSSELQRLIVADSGNNDDNRNRNLKN